MFTGIVEKLGTVQRLQAKGNVVEIDIGASTGLCSSLKVGASVMLDGVCQTVLSHEVDRFRVAAEAETLRVTTLGNWQVGDLVNLERALPVGGRLDGHMVLGHVDGTAEVLETRQEDRTQVLRLQVPTPLWPYVVPKGCITLDGVSLTVGPEIQEGCFEVFLIPYTWEHTTLSRRPVGSRINVESDILARYVMHLLQGTGAGEDSAQSGIPGAPARWDQLARRSDFGGKHD